MNTNTPWQRIAENLEKTGHLLTQLQDLVQTSKGLVQIQEGEAPKPVAKDILSCQVFPRADEPYVMLHFFSEIKDSSQTFATCSTNYLNFDQVRSTLDILMAFLVDAATERKSLGGRKETFFLRRGLVENVMTTVDQTSGAVTVHYDVPRET